MDRRSFIQGTAIALAVAVGAAKAQPGWPQKPMRLIVSFPPGGGTDMTSRLVAEKLTSGSGWTVVIDNRAAPAISSGTTRPRRSRWRAPSWWSRTK